MNSPQSMDLKIDSIKRIRNDQSGVNGLSPSCQRIQLARIQNLLLATRYSKLQHCRREKVCRAFFFSVM